MNYYFAPMEGITGYLFRNVHHAHFPGADRYYSPFLSANHNYSFQNKEKRDVAPENNASLTLVPQLLTKNADEFVWGVKELHKAGYAEINLNLGCPSSTVSSKGKGAGFLAHPDELDRFFERIFTLLDKKDETSVEECPDACRKECRTDSDTNSKETGQQNCLPRRARISVKTRIGYADPKEALPLMRIFNRYPISELTIHARVRNAMYNGAADVDTFAEMYAIREIPVAYNGDIYTKEDAGRIASLFPELTGIMIGRGAIQDPSLIRQCQGGPAATAAEWKAFHDDIASVYFSTLSERITIGRMKELWYYWERHFPGYERDILTIKKAKDRMSYFASVNAFLAHYKETNVR